VGITNKQRGGQILSGLGLWQDVPFDPANFYGSGGMTWTLTPPLLTNRYCRIGNAIVWNVYIAVSTLGGAAGNSLYAKAPTGISKYAMGSGLTLLGSPAQWVAVRGNTGSPGVIGLSLASVANFVLGSAQVQFSITYEVGP
jgi:hypothetical protein